MSEDMQQETVAVKNLSVVLVPALPAALVCPTFLQAIFGVSFWVTALPLSVESMMFWHYYNKLQREGIRR
ncbi:hypothetical protein Micbo1qcDRAFT_209389 [Microdochium bolleyi]|uniref:Uncharacterized protein n=1 Tax=Microdochium bolleyi TaxID=196109 RepID=A0A136IM24_9PEZI|nr:hypothetical protein Micbo1qcDRAFT_209389 [Microdochium bolleyi]